MHIQLSIIYKTKSKRGIKHNARTDKKNHFSIFYFNYEKLNFATVVHLNDMCTNIEQYEKVP